MTRPLLHSRGRDGVGGLWLLEERISSDSTGLIFTLRRGQEAVTLLSFDGSDCADGIVLVPLAADNLHHAAIPQVAGGSNNFKKLLLIHGFSFLFRFLRYCRVTVVSTVRMSRARMIHCTASFMAVVRI
jgi:hypothetical protein